MTKCLSHNRQTTGQIQAGTGKEDHLFLRGKRKKKADGYSDGLPFRRETKLAADARSEEVMCGLFLLCFVVD